MPAGRICAWLPLALLALAASANGAVLGKVTSIPHNHDKVIDTRPLSSCRRASLDRSICVPVEDLLAPQRRLANWSGIYWLLGSAGLSGDEHLLIAGESAERREFVAGLLLLAGQRRITLLDAPVSNLLGDSSAPGQQRASTRTAIYRAALRSDLLMLQADLQKLVHGSDLLLDGRSEAEYHGALIHAGRGGHIPGARHSPLQSWRSEPSGDAAAYRHLRPVAYAHDSYDSIIYLAALHAAGVDARVYLPGWVEWATNGALPIDSASYPAATRQPVAPPPTTAPRALFAAGATGAAMLLAMAYYGGKAAARRRA